VVLDVQMPGMNGIEVQACLRRARAEIPVIFITAQDDRVVRTQALAAGAVASYLNRSTMRSSSEPSMPLWDAVTGRTDRPGMWRVAVIHRRHHKVLDQGPIVPAG